MRTKLQWFMADYAAMLGTGLVVLVAIIAIDEVSGAHLLKSLTPAPFWLIAVVFIGINLPGFILIFVFRLNPFWIGDWLAGTSQETRRSFRYFCRWL